MNYRLPRCFPLNYSGLPTFPKFKENLPLFSSNATRGLSTFYASDLILLSTGHLFPVCWILSFSVLLSLSSHPAIISPCYYLTLLLSYPCYYLTLLLSHPAIISPYYYLTLLLSHPVIISPCYCQAQLQLNFNFNLVRS